LARVDSDDQNVPWRELKPMDLKVKFISGYLFARLNFNRLCAAHGISRTTCYKGVASYNADSINASKNDFMLQHVQVSIIQART
jgi:putative transposase